MCSSDLSDSASGADAVSALATFVCSVSESATALDTPSSSAVFFTAVNETAVLLDTASAAFLWNVINDAESSGWVVIGDSKAYSINDVSSFGGASFVSSPFTGSNSIYIADQGWSSIDNSNPNSWNNINDSKSYTVNDVSSFGGASFASSPFAGSNSVYVFDQEWSSINNSNPNSWNNIKTVN